MCKVLIMAGLNPDNEKVWDFAKAMADIMSARNDDGLGYTAVDEAGNIFGERWLHNDEAFSQREQFTKPLNIDKSKIDRLKEMFGDAVGHIEEEIAVPAKEKYGTFGNLTPRITAMTLHARAATGTVGYNNVHPFVDMDESTSVIHNGVISNYDKDKDWIRSTCDSERILNQYIEHDVGKTPADIQNMVDNLRGWFACGILSLDGSGRRILDIFRTNAQLGMVFVDELDTAVFATDIDDVKEACKQLRWNISSKSRLINENKMLRLDAITGKPIMSIKYTYNNSYKSNRFAYHHNEGYYLGAGQGTTSFHDDWVRRVNERKEKEAAEAKPVTLTLVPEPEDHKYTETEQQEINEWRKAGFSEQEINYEFTRNHKETKVLVDKLNENDAANDKYFMDKQQGLWIKRKHSRQ